MDEEKIIEQFVYNLSIGIPSIESQGNYNAQNKEGSAAGKYQFTEYWLNKAGKDSIQSFAKNSKIFKTPESLEEFKKDKILQDAYFRHYAKNVLYPQAKKAYSGPNPSNLSLESMGALFHFKPATDDKFGNTGAFKQIRTGKFDEGTKKGVDGAKYTNASSIKYINKINSSIKQNGGKFISKKDLLENNIGSVPEGENIVEQFKQAENAIDNSSLTPQEKEVKRKELYENVSKQGNAEIVNSFIEKRNSEQKQKHDQDVSDYKNLLDLSKKINFGFSEKEGNNKGVFIGMKDSDFEQVKRLRKKFDLSNSKFSPETGKYIFDGNEIIEALKTSHKEVTGEKLDIPENIDPKKLDQNYFFALAQGLSDVMHGDFSNRTYGKLNINNTAPVKKFKGVSLIPENYTPEEIKSTKKENSNSSSNNKNQTKTTQTKNVDSPKNETDSSLAEQFFQTQLSLGATSGQEFNYEAGAQEIPVDAVMGLALGLIGNNQVENANIPLRTEDISEAMKSYIAEVKERSEKGLPVEIEAAMKNQLAESYQGGLENLANSAAGNRATILGNLGQLESAKNKGLVAIQVADFEAKDRAFQQYGDALKYVEEFDSRRDIANHEIKYVEAKEKQKIGRDLATAGFAKLIDSIRYQKENGPGSVNDQYRSMMMQNIFGFDPKMPDDETGETPGTKSFYEKNKAFAKQDFETTKELYNQFGSLNPDQKVAFNGLLSQTQDKEKMKGFIEYLQNNPEQKASGLSMDNLDIALKNNDFSALGKNRKALLEQPKGIGQIETSLPEVNIGEVEIPELATSPIVPETEQGLAAAGINEAYNNYYNNN